jgi:hypothetical protein
MRIGFQLPAPSSQQNPPGTVGTFGAVRAIADSVGHSELGINGWKLEAGSWKPV